MRATARLALIAVAAAGCGPRDVGGPAVVAARERHGRQNNPFHCPYPL